MDTLGQLRALEGETEFSHIPDWFEWERSQVRKQLEEGTYRFEDEVEVYSLVEPWKFRKLGMDEELAQTAADAEVEGDMDKVAECYEKHVKAVEANAYQKFLDERKDPASGRGKGGDDEDAASKLAKQAAGRRGTADSDVLKNYMI